MRKLLIGIFICFGSIFLMSQNVGAVDAVFDINDYNLARSQSLSSVTWTYENNYIETNMNGVLKGNRSKLLSFGILEGNYKAGDIVTLDLVVISNAGTYTIGQTVTGTITNYLTEPYIVYSNDYSLLSVDKISFDDSSKLINYYNSMVCVPQGTGTTCTNYPEMTFGYQFYQSYRITVQLKRNLDNYSLVFNGGGSNYPLIEVFGYNLDNTIQAEMRVYRINQYRPITTKEEEAAQKELESTENIENQTPPSQSQTGDGAAATNLIGAFSGFVSALGGLSATNCNLTLNFPSFAGGSRVVNVCQNKDKAGNIISVFSSLTLIIFYVPLAIRLLTMIYNEIRSFTNG